MTAPDPLREDEVALALANVDCERNGVPPITALWMLPGEGAAHYRAYAKAILRLDQVREGRGK